MSFLITIVTVSTELDVSRQCNTKTISPYNLKPQSKLSNMPAWLHKQGILVAMHMTNPASGNTILSAPQNSTLSAFSESPNKLLDANTKGCTFQYWTIQHPHSTALSESGKRSTYMAYGMISRQCHSQKPGIHMTTNSRVVPPYMALLQAGEMV